MSHTETEDLSLFRRRDAWIVSFFIPIFIMIVIFVQRGIFPFGDECFLRTDLYHQYAPFFSEFKYKLSTGGSLLYSWDVGMGVNFSAIYAYYLASPLNWLIILCPKKYVIEFITIMIVLKTGACGLTMTWYLQKHTDSDRLYPAFFGIFYAMSAYMCAYSWNVMWLDCILLFPLIIYGAEKLVSENRWLMYTVTLGLSITSNYYISIMICMFLVIWFFCLVILEGKMTLQRFLRTGVQFACCSLIAGGLAAAVLVPEVFALQATASGDFSFPKTFTAYFSILDMLARHIGNVSVETGLDHWPNIYCGVAVFQLMILYVVNRKVPLKEKAVYGTVLIFFLASFSINVLNYIWHGFHYPNSLPARQGFIYIFLVLYLCCRAVYLRDGNTKADLKLSFLLSFCFIIFCQKFVDNEDFHFVVYYAALLFVALYGLILWMIRVRRLNLNTAAFFLLALVAVEAAINMTATTVPTTNRKNYVADNADVISLRNTVADQPFTRFEKVKRKSKDDGAWMNFPSVSLFSSMAYKNLGNFLRNLGCESSVNAYSITGSTPFADAFLNVRYAFYSSETFNPALKLKASSGEIWLYENPSTFPLAYMVAPDLQENWVLSLDDPAEVQNDLATLYSTSPLLIRNDSSTSGATCTFTAEADGEYYAYAVSSKINKVRADLPGGSATFDNLNRHFFMELGTLYEGEKVTLQESGDASGADLNCHIYRFDYDALAELREAMVQEEMEITEFSDTHIEGTVTAANAGMLLTSIPYDKGWTVKADGRTLDTEEYFNAFLAARLPAGTHHMTFDFRPRGRTEGILITLVSLALLAGAAVFSLLRRKRKGTDPDPEDADEDDLSEEDTEAETLAGEPEDPGTEMTEDAAAAEESHRDLSPEPEADIKKEMTAQTEAPEDKMMVQSDAPEGENE